MRILLSALLLMTLPVISVASGQSFVVDKPEFRQLVPDGAVVEKLAGDFKFIEGPAWNVAGGFLVFSDIPANKLFRYDPTTKSVTVFREPSRNANGNFYDSNGTLYTCEHGSREVTVFFGDDKTKVPPKPLDPQATPGMVEAGFAALNWEVATRFEDKPFNSPNDVVAKSDGTVWFTDPTYGLAGRPKEQATNNVYCLDQNTPEFHDTVTDHDNTVYLINRMTRKLRAVATDFVQPNGLCFSPDEKLLYIADSDKPRHVRVFVVTADNRLTNGRVFCQIDNGAPDGIRCDRHGNLFSSAGDGVHIFAPDGTRLGKIFVPETPANLCFGGKDGDELFITAHTSLYHVKLTTTAPGKPGKESQ